MKTKNLTLSLLALLFVFATQTFAANYVVTVGGDAGDTICDASCTLRDAVDEANATIADDTVTFAVGLTSIILTNEISIANNGTLTITGNGARVLTIDGGAGSNRIFFIESATATIAAVTLTGGNAEGSAVYSRTGNVTLESVIVRDNIGGGGGTVYVGAWGAGTNVISNSTLSGNQDVDCAGFRTAGGTLTVTNSTLSGNLATIGVGGGFCVLGSGNLMMRNSTVAGNSAVAGGGFYQGGGTVDLGNTLIAGNTASNFPEIYKGGGIFTSSGYNLVGDSAGDSLATSGSISYQTSDMTDTNPMLGPLTYNGGTTPTHAVYTGSPVIDQGHSFASTTDQRGRMRPVNDLLLSDSLGGDGADIGAFEKPLGPTNAIVTVGGRIMNQKGSGISNVRVTITDASGATRAVISNSFGYYRIGNVRSGQSYIFSAFSKRHSFEPNTVVRSIMDDTDDIDFVTQ